MCIRFTYGFLTSLDLIQFFYQFDSFMNLVRAILQPVILGYAQVQKDYILANGDESVNLRGGIGLHDFRFRERVRQMTAPLSTVTH